MAKVIQRTWIGQHDGPTKRDRQACQYEIYLPDRLSGRKFVLDGLVAAEVAEAEAAVAKLNVEASALIDTEALARILLRAEAVASSRIEGLEVGARRLLEAEAVRGLGDAPADITANEVIGNIDAMVYAIESVREGESLSVELLLEIHRRLLAGTLMESYGGCLRDVQNWIGGSAYNPCSAAFVPPPPEAVAELMADLCEFCNDDALPAIAQAAIAHAQFETIHPFVDGNGRTGRALIHLVLRRRGLAPRVLPPVSLVLATWAKTYVNGLMGYRYIAPPSSAQAHTGINEWIAQFANATTRSVADASDFEQRAREIEAGWRELLGSVRKSSAADLLLRSLVGAPVITVNSAAALIGRTYPAANQAVSQLVQAGILKQVTLGKRNRAFEAPEIIAAFTDLERQLASPDRDTKTSTPERPVPQRRKSQTRRD